MGLLLLTLPAWAQLKVGDDVSLNMNADIGFGYSGDYGDLQTSDHSFGLNGDASVNGYFYNPNFVNFFVTPIYNRSQANSGTGSLTDSSSVNAGAGIFTGSHFPGSVSFGKTFDSTNTFGVPGLPTYTTSGNTTQFGLGWSELVPGLPPVSAQYFQSSTDSTFLGYAGNDHSSTRDLSVQSQYKLDGWIMTARFSDLWTHTELPSFLTAGEESTNAGNSKTFSFDTSHRLPLSGSFAFGYSYGSFDGEGDGASSSGSNNSFTGTASFTPWRRLTTDFGVEYNTNLTGFVEQQLISAGSVVPEVNFGSNSNSLLLYSYDNLYIGKGLSAAFDFSRTQQEVYGESVAANHFSAVLNYSIHKPLWGALNFYGGVNDQSTDAGHQGTGLVGGVSLNKRMWGFEWSGNFAYAQDVQTVLATVDTSQYSYLASVRRDLSRHLRWYSNFNGYHTGLSQIAGSSSHAEGYGTNLMYRGYGGGFTYNSSYGTALLTAGGLVPVPVTVGPVLSGNQYLLENGTSYSVVATANPINRWTINANFSKALSDTTTPTLYSSSLSKIFMFYTAFQLRKVSFVGGYTKLTQGPEGGTSGALPVGYSSFYIGIQRWFKPF